MNIKKYLEGRKIRTVDQLASHIMELKRNTYPDVELISELVHHLEIGYSDFGIYKDDAINLSSRAEKEVIYFLKENSDFKSAGGLTEKGVKKNKNKPQLSLLFIQFPKALEAITKCSEYGHNKYKETDKDYLNFQRVNGGSKTYADAGLRHRIEKGNDIESGLPHQYHVAWNALAELEIWIKENQ